MPVRRRAAPSRARPGAEASAHRVMRAELSRYHDRSSSPSSSRSTATSTPWPVRTGHIETLVPKADVAAFLLVDGSSLASSPSSQSWLEDAATEGGRIAAP
jgi:hypothetical protein